MKRSSFFARAFDKRASKRGTALTRLGSFASRSAKLFASRSADRRDDDDDDDLPRPNATVPTSLPLFTIAFG